MTFCKAGFHANGLIVKTMAIVLPLSLALLPICMNAQTPVPPPAVAVAKSYGFTEAELQKIKGGDILSKDLPEKSDKELAGVVAVFLPKTVTELAEILVEGQLLKSDRTIKALQVWKPEASAEKAFAGLAANAETQAKLKSRYEAYRKNGLKGAGVPGEQLALAIKAILPTDRWPGYSKALLNYPDNQLAGMEHRFVCYQQELEKLPTFILSHRACVKSDHAALITEQRYYVSQTYNCRFIACDCVELPGGTVMFYVNCLFTDQVAGIGSGLRHSIGRKRMLTDVAANLKNVREQLQHNGSGEKPQSAPVDAKRL